MIPYKVIQLRMIHLSRRVSIRLKAFHRGTLKSLHLTEIFLKSLKVTEGILMINHPCVYFSMGYQRQVFKHLKMDSAVEYTENISDADAILALLSKIKKNSRIQAAAYSNDIPIYVTKTSSLTQLTKAIKALVTDYDNDFEDIEDEYSQINESEKADALEEARIAIEQVVIPKGERVELLPRASNIMLLQKELIHKYKLQAQRVGSEADVRLCVLPFQDQKEEKDHDGDGDDDVDDDEFSELSETNGSPNPMNRLPLLPN